MRYAQGMGYYQGTGMGNLYNAQASSINADTFMRWNQYWYEAHLEATRRYVAKRDGDADQDQGHLQRDTSRTFRTIPPRGTSRTAMRLTPLSTSSRPVDFQLVTENRHGTD